MISILKEKLWHYIIWHNPDLVYSLQERYKVDTYLEEKVSSVMPIALRMLEEGKGGRQIHELCLEQMTRELKPSRYLFIIKIIEREFEEQYDRLRELGLLAYEGVNLVEHCHNVFEKYCFATGNADSEVVYQAIKDKIADYFFDQQMREEDQGPMQ